MTKEVFVILGVRLVSRSAESHRIRSESLNKILPFSRVVIDARSPFAILLLIHGEVCNLDKQSDCKSDVE